MRTRFTDLAGVTVPVMQGGMSSVARAPLVAASSRPPAAARHRSCPPSTMPG
ncbi:MAG TPA: hypothetical protein VM262_05750 [Acidimicrobiales bacterium]|nr:hypothetical protein [Acidimicrobiales bacterium]